MLSYIERQPTGGDQRLVYVEQDGKRIGSIKGKYDYQNRMAYSVCLRRMDEGGKDYDWRDSREGYANSMFQAKKTFEKVYGSNMREKVKRTSPVASLPAGEGSDFYPTPRKLAAKMLQKIKWDEVQSILEPSAGKGDLVDALMQCLRDNQYSKKGLMPTFIAEGILRNEENIECMELDPNLRMILEGKGYRVVSENFLEDNSPKWYDLILMNPPFSEGDRHLMKAISMMENSGGQIVCLLNAETIRNPYTNLRLQLKRFLEKYNADIEYVENAFQTAERRTGVEIAIVYLSIPQKRCASRILDDLERAKQEEYETEMDGPRDLVTGDWMEQLITAYQYECKIGVEFLKEFNAVAPYIMSGQETYSSPLISLKIGDHNIGSQIGSDDINRYLNLTRKKYWTNLFEKEQLTSLMTSDIRKEYLGRVSEMSNVEFSAFNIRKLMRELSAQLVSGVEQSIMDLFEQFSAKHSWYPECEKNIHYYSGWATNKAHKVGMKVILPINGFCSYSWEKDKLDEYKIAGVITDLERAMTYLDSGRTEFKFDPHAAIRLAMNRGETTIGFTWFDVRFYKKGTAHIKFRESARPIIDRLNIFAGRKKNWLPPDYGRKHYDDLSEEARTVVDGFQGKEEYERVVADAGFYLSSPSQEGAFALRA